MTHRRVAVVYNPAAGRRRLGRIRRAVAALRELAAAVEVLETTGPGSAADLARQASGSGLDAVLACGGDGTLNEVINGVAPGRTAVGVLPAGTANVVARELGLPRDPVQAARLLPRLTARRVPLGRVWCDGAEGRYFALACGAGLDAELLAGAEALGKRRWGMLAYWLAALRLLASRLEVLQVSGDGRTRQCTLALACRVRRIGGGLRVVRSSHLLDDCLEVALFPGRSPWRYAGYLAAALAGRLPETFLARRVEFRGRARVEADGELVGRLPARVEVQTDALTLLGLWAEPWTT